MIDFGIKDIVDILIVALLLYYVYRLMKKSGTLSLSTECSPSSSCGCSLTKYST